MQIRDFIKAWGPVIIWLLLIFLGSSDLMSAEHTSRFITPFLHWLKPDVSAATITHFHLVVRKAAHLTEYAILAGLLFRALRTLIDSARWRVALAFFPALIFAAADEFRQSLVPSRNSSLGDVCIDCAGALLGILICRAIHVRWRGGRLRHEARG